MTMESAILQLGTQVQEFTAAYKKPPAKRTLVARAVTIFLGTVPLIISISTLAIQVPSLNRSVSDAIESSKDNRANLPLPIARIGTPVASSYRQDVNDAGVFFPLRLLDDNAATPWVECGKGMPVHSGESRMLGSTCRAKDYGIGEFVVIPLTQATDLKLLRVRNGYEKRMDLFFRNGRVHDLRVTVWSNKEATRSLNYELSDEPEYQNLNLRSQGVTRIKLEIRSAYPGETFLGQPPYTDTAISDVQIIPSKVPR